MMLLNIDYQVPQLNGQCESYRFAVSSYNHSFKDIDDLVELGHHIDKIARVAPGHQSIVSKREDVVRNNLYVGIYHLRSNGYVKPVTLDELPAVARSIIDNMGGRLRGLYKRREELATEVEAAQQHVNDRDIYQGMYDVHALTSLAIECPTAFASVKAVLTDDCELAQAKMKLGQLMVEKRSIDKAITELGTMKTIVCRATRSLIEAS
jgi:hypothetical protein